VQLPVVELVMLVCYEKLRELKTTSGDNMPPPLHLFDIRCKSFSYRHSCGKQIMYSEICEFIH